MTTTEAMMTPDVPNTLPTCVELSPVGAGVDVAGGGAGEEFGAVFGCVVGGRISTVRFFVTTFGVGSDGGCKSRDVLMRFSPGLMVYLSAEVWSTILGLVSGSEDLE